MSVLFSNRPLLDCRVVPIHEVRNTLLDDFLRGTGTRGHKHRFTTFKPLRVDLIRSVDEISRPACFVRDLR